MKKVPTIKIHKDSIFSNFSDILPESQDLEHFDQGDHSPQPTGAGLSTSVVSVGGIYKIYYQQQKLL